jgi:FMN phosphatase YigB (HAD superfamily)
MFRTALDALGIDPTDALHIGDLRRTDVAGARALGMRTVRIKDVYDDPTDLPDADNVVGSHTEFQSLLTETGAVRSRR